MNEGNSKFRMVQQAWMHAKTLHHQLTLTGCVRGVSCSPCIWEASWCGYSRTVWVTMAWFWHFLNQHGTGTADSEGIRPETDTGKSWEAINWVSTWWRIMGRGSVVQISARPKVTLSQTSRLFIGILYIAAVVIVRTINSRAKKNIINGEQNHFRHRVCSHDLFFASMHF